MSTFEEKVLKQLTESKHGLRPVELARALGAGMKPGSASARVSISLKSLRNKKLVDRQVSGKGVTYSVIKQTQRETDLKSLRDSIAARKPVSENAPGNKTACWEVKLTKEQAKMWSEPVLDPDQLVAEKFVYWWTKSGPFATFLALDITLDVQSAEKFATLYGQFADCFAAGHKAGAAKVEEEK